MSAALSFRILSPAECRRFSALLEAKYLQRNHLAAPVPPPGKEAAAGQPANEPALSTARPPSDPPDVKQFDRLLAGMDEERTRLDEEAEIIARGFCPDCGAPLDRCRCDYPWLGTAHELGDSR